VDTELAQSKGPKCPLDLRNPSDVMLGTADWLRGAERRALAGRLNRERALSRAPAKKTEQAAEQPAMRVTDRDRRTGNNHVKATDWRTAPDTRGGRERALTLRFHGGLFGPPVRGGAKRSGPQATRSKAERP
jgi:hypothetical protein